MSNNELSKLISDLRAIPTGITEADLTPTERAVLILAERLEKEIGDAPWEYQVGDTVCNMADKCLGTISAVRLDWVRGEWDIVVIGADGRQLKDEEWLQMTTHSGNGKRTVVTPKFKIGDVVDVWSIRAGSSFPSAVWGRDGELERGHTIIGFEAARGWDDKVCYYTDKRQRAWEHLIRATDA